MISENCNYSLGTPNVKFRPKLCFGYMIASLFFLFNPDINVIDILPDIFGYILMSLGLSRFALMNEHIAEAYSKFKKMILVSAGKLASVIFIFGMTDSANRPSAFLLFSFSFAVIELIFLIPAYNELFAGLRTLADRHNGSVIYHRSKKSGHCYSEKMHIFSVAFVILKSFSSTWPEFISLVTSEYTDSFVMYLYEYIGAFRIIAFLPAFIIGCVWLSYMSRFFRNVSKDTEFIKNITNTFTRDIITKEGAFVKRALNTILTLLVVGSIFCIDFPLGVGIASSEINVIPDFIAATLILISGIMLKRYVKNYKVTVITSTVYLVMTSVASAMKLYFVIKFGHFTAINKIDEAYYLFYGMCIATLVENIAFIAAVIGLTLVLKEVIKNYTGYNAYSGHNETEKITSLQKELTGKLIFMIIFAVIGGTTATIYEFLLPEKHTLAQYMWFIDLITQGFFIAFTMRCLFAIKDEIDNRFMLEI